MRRIRNETSFLAPAAPVNQRGIKNRFPHSIRLAFTRQFAAFYLACFACLAANAAPSPGPQPVAATEPIAAPQDLPYPGVLSLTVDATDVDRHIFRVHETVPTADRRELVLLLPEWLPGWHAPGGRDHISRLAGLTITADGKPVAWQRDVVDVFAFHVAVPSGAASLELEYQYLSPPSADIGALEVTPNILTLDWSSVVLYPAGYFSRQIKVDAELKLPQGWHLASALPPANASDPETAFQRTDLETLVDSPVYAGRFFSRVDLDPGAATPVYLDLFADRPHSLESTTAQITAHRSLIQQAYKLFGSRHYRHYDFLLTLSEALGENGLEHHQCSEEGALPGYFTDWDKTPDFRDLLPHEFVHSWNGKFRRPADLWTPNFNVPMRNSLLWVYEGQTEYWGQVLTARSGLWSKELALEELALIAAQSTASTGRKWRPLQDTTGDEIFSPRQQRQAWTSWQRFEDYYDVGQLIWLEADTLIRERSNGRKSLDDFAHLFFGIGNGSMTPVTYSFEDVVAALNTVQPYDWSKFLRDRLDAVNVDPPLDGIRRGGYRLVFNDVSGDIYQSRELREKMTDLTYSIGLSVDKDGKLKAVLWEGPAYQAGLTVDTVLVAVDGVAFDPDRLKEDIRAARTASGPIQLIVRSGDQFRVVPLDYHAGLRYPHLERDTTQPALLDEILAPRN
ncbi:MAG: peptidase M61 [Verrucomicrobiota bacterium]